jgi:hypothetical protein
MRSRFARYLAARGALGLIIPQDDGDEYSDIEGNRGDVIKVRTRLDCRGAIGLIIAQDLPLPATSNIKCDCGATILGRKRGSDKIGLWIKDESAINGDRRKCGACFLQVGWLSGLMAESALKESGSWSLWLDQVHRRWPRDDDT